jgi:DNA polymerase elongation subunit (family B)
MTKNQELEFQIYDYLADHEEIVDENADDEVERPGQFIIHTFGRCADGKSVYAKIINFTPYFYVLLPARLQSKSKSELEIIVKQMYEFLKGKDNRKVYYTYKSTLKEIQLVKMKRAEGFTNDKEFYFARLVFNNEEGMKKFRYYLENNEIMFSNITILNRNIKYKIYEANLPAMFRCFHIRDVSGCSWINVTNYEMIEDDESKESRCDIEITVDWRNLNPIKKDFNAPLRIASFDIECNSIDGEFPQARRKGDCVIQIGVTYTYLGKNEPYRQYIVCLKETSPIENVIVESCDTEEDLMRAFLNEINENDCDIITGYNMFFFDQKYMFQRCRDVLKIEKELSFMSKLKARECKFIWDKKLASSALGENLLSYWDTPGRVHVDLMKDVQKTFTLPMYKLDYVSSKFIRGEVLKYKVVDFNKFELLCKSISDIYVGEYIHLEVVKGFVSDDVGEKYCVISIDPKEKTIVVKGDDFLKSELDTAKLGGVINWSQAKDDVGPKDIFRLQKGSADDRSIVAKYCVKDCKLVNLLINKLEIITKNLEMANVCYVPLSYLFTRGQGIKLFSLCLKEFRKQQYAFPVLKVDKYYRCLNNKCKNEYMNAWQCPECKSKLREELETENSSFEGAIVFDPVPQVDYESCATKDYMSLYPASIMHKNMSHETIVEDPEFDNLPNVTYFNAQYKESDGSIQYRRYAKVGDKLGVIPTILNNLLRERKAIKKLMGKETDPFKYKILDAKQLAVKITANSLYGQLGASTSAVCKRDIAACTTSTGREMLILAKKYDEEILPWLMNGLKHYYMNDDMESVNILYDLELKAREDNEFIQEVKDYVTKDIHNLTFQPVIRYGDTDSIFSCYRFRENTTKLDDDKAMIVWKNIIAFARVLIEPYFNTDEIEIFNKIFMEYYSDDKITSLMLPPGPVCVMKPKHHAIVLPIEDRMKQFVKEYMEESYLPWLWTLAELVEKDYTFMFDIKLQQWAEHQLSKIRLTANNLYDNRKETIMKPVMDYLGETFTNKYDMPSNAYIKELANKFNSNNTDCFPFANEIKLNGNELNLQCKRLLEKTIKEKWVYSGERKELLKTINMYLNNVVVNETNNKVKYSESLIHFIIDYMSINKNFDIEKLNELLIKNLLNDTTMDVKFDQDKLEEYTKDFINTYNKNNGKKTLDEIIDEFLQKDLQLNFNKSKDEHYNKVINFVNKNMRRLDMSDIEVGETYQYFWVQPRWTVNKVTKQRSYCVDIYEGGKSIIDHRTLDYGMKMGKLSGELVKKHLPFPHDLEYEKTFWPFAILTKKRYVGNKYEMDPNKYKLDYMGIVLKRRDNAPIVKEICGGIIDYLINKRSPEGAKNYTIKCIQDMFDGKYDIKYFLQSRTLKLKESYKDWTRIAHVYLADKISKRDPGNVPQSGDRIEYAVIKVPPSIDGSKLLQGDIIETPKFIKEQKLEIDYLFYLTNQIMNPALQFLELVDKKAINIFNTFIDKYSLSKGIKNKEKELKEIEKKNKLEIKEKAKQERLRLREEKNKLKNNIKTSKKKNALDLLIDIKTMNDNKSLLLEIKKLIDEINEYMDHNKDDNEKNENADLSIFL